MPHVSLLGDSIFDNAAYTRGEPDVVSHLRSLLPADWQATLVAVDGATTRSMAGQLARVPADTTHVVLSIGGNDALGEMDLLRTPVRSTAEALELFASRVSAFERAYHDAAHRVVALGRDTTLCTIYNGNLETEIATIARMGLTLFNDVILQMAIAHRLRAIELRQICTAPDDYANPIEPSGNGGRKIARAVAEAIGARPSTLPATTVMGA